jgi:6,7-dimethyl-8-ribityllumazine synthase
MSGVGAPELAVDGGGMRVIVVASRWHDQVMSGLLEGALAALEESGVQDVQVVRVPGAIELSVASLHAARSGVDAVVALGVVVRGGTPHFDYVCQSVTYGLTEVALTTGVPVGFGVLTVDNELQALDRVGRAGSHEDKGAEAALAALGTVLALRELTAPDPV